MDKVDIMMANIVDDDLDMVQILVDKLESRGVHPESYIIHDDIDEFLATLTDDISVAAIDHNIRGSGEGMNAMRTFKERNRDNYGIVVTGQENYKIVIGYIKAGADDYIDKNEINYLDALADAIVIGFIKAAQSKKEATERKEYLELMQEKSKKIDELINKLP